MPSQTDLSIVIPVLNEEALIVDQIAHVRKVAPQAELIIVDGGSQDLTANIAIGLADEFVQTEPGRAAQMNLGAKMANGKYLLFLHADTQLPDNFSEVFSSWCETNPLWGYFPVRLSGSSRAFRVIEYMINFRTKITAGATGDQCQVIQTQAFSALGGFQEIPLMEDLAMSRYLRRLLPPKIFASQVISSSRRWEENGVLRTVLLMWSLRTIYTLGLHPRYFFKAYSRRCS